MPQVQTAAGTLYYTDHRKPESKRKPVLLIHGAGGSHLDWPPQLRRLPEANAIALDLPGHGKSPGPGLNTIEGYAGAVVALLDALEVPRCIVAGHSMGGAIAQQLALDHPDRVAGLILIGTGAKLRVHPDILDKAADDLPAVAALLKDWMWSDDVPGEPREVGYQRLVGMPGDVVQADYVACNTFDVRERLGAITAPTLVFGGTADKMTPFKFSEYLAEHIPNASLVKVENGGHMMALEQPEAVAEHVRAWLVDQQGGDTHAAT